MCKHATQFSAWGLLDLNQPIIYIPHESNNFKEQLKVFCFDVVYNTKTNINSK